MDSIAVVMSCYFPDGEIGEARYRYARRTVDALKEHLHGPSTKLVVTVDGLDNYLSKEFRADGYTVLNGSHNGIGSSLNRALAWIRQDVWMYITDDWLLTRPLDLTKPFRMLTEHGYEYVRLGPLHPNIIWRTRFDNNLGWWLHGEGEYGYIFSTRPFLATKRFYETIGQFDEGLNAYETERLYNERVVRNLGLNKCFAALLSDGTEWLHIGEVEVGDINI